MIKIFQRFIVTSLIISAFISPLSTTALAFGFSDVKSGDYDFIAVKFLAEHEIFANIPSFAGGKFNPDAPITKSDALKITLNTFGNPTIAKNPYPENQPDLSLDFGHLTKAEALRMVLLQENRDTLPDITKAPYPDVPVDSWYAPYAQIAKDRGLILTSRTNGGEFLADQEMTRLDFTTLIYKTLFSSLGSNFGRATYYADKLAGRGMVDNGNGIFAVAHKTLPKGTYLLVTSTANGKSVKVKVNDRGPYATGVDLDLSKSAFAALTSVGTGIIRVEYKIIP